MHQLVNPNLFIKVDVNLTMQGDAEAHMNMKVKETNRHKDAHEHDSP